MDAIEQSSAFNALAHLTRVPIAQLSPDLDNLAGKSFLANVVLVWPYSSSAKSFSLLLVEPDVLLRHAQGQIKVTFHGRVAEKIAESHVGIGATICLALKDCKFLNNAELQQAPGRCVAWEAHFENGVSLEIYRDSQDPLAISMEAQATEPQRADFVLPSTPSGKSPNLEFDLAPSTGSWGSPAFCKSNRTSFGGTIRTAFDPFAEDDGFVPGKGRKRPRYSLQRDDWQVLTEPESLQEQEGPVDWQRALDQAIDQELAEAEASEPSDDLMTDPDETPARTEGASQESYPVFAKPSLELTGSILERRAGESHLVSSHEQIDIHGTSLPLPTDTPQIRPIPSPGLPIPSPIVSSNASPAGYFPPWNASTQVQEAQVIPQDINALSILQDPFIDTHDTETIHSAEAETAKMAEPTVRFPQDEQVLGPDLVLGDDTESSFGRETDFVEAFKPIEEVRVVQDEVSLSSSDGEGPISIEPQPDDMLDRNSRSRSLSEHSGSEQGLAAVQAEIGTEHVNIEAQTSDAIEQEYIDDDEHLSRGSSVLSSRLDDELVEHSEAIDAANIGIARSNLGSPYHTSVPDHIESAEPANQSVEYSHSTVAFDQDAVDALEMMRATREGQPEVSRIMDEEGAIEGDINHRRVPDDRGEDDRMREDNVDALSPAKDDLDRTSIQDDDEEEDEMLEDQEVYYEESVHSYNSQYDYEGDDGEDDIHYPHSGTGSNQGDFSVDESSDEEFAHGQNLPSMGGEPEVIVLDSDSDDDDKPRSNHATAPDSEFSSNEDVSDRSESALPAVSAVDDLEIDEQETPGAQYSDSEAGYHAAVVGESDIGGSEQSEEREYNHENDRVHDSDLENDEADESDMEDDHVNDNEMENQSEQDLYEIDLPSEMAPLHDEQKDEDEEMEDMKLIEEIELSESQPAIRPDLQPEVSADQEFDEQQPRNIDPRLFDTVGSQHPEPSESSRISAEQKAVAGSDNVAAYMHGDGQCDYPTFASITRHTTDVLSGNELVEEPAIEGPEPLGGLVPPPNVPQSKQQVLTPDPAQETAPTPQQGYNDELESEYAGENESDTGLDLTMQPARSPNLDQDDNVGTESIAHNQEANDHAHDDATATSAVTRSAQLPSTPDRSCSVGVLISTESPKPPTVLVTKPPIPDRHASGLRSKLSYFAPLATLFDHYNALVDTISIVHEASAISRAKTGSKDWFVTIELTDPSMAGTTVRAQIFRRYKSSMPTLAEGTAILLRDFRVKSLDHAVMLVSVESSAWAVFDGSGPDAETNGPPVEYDAQERAYASGLRRWYVEVGSGWVADRMLQDSIERDSSERDLSPSSQAQSESSSPDSKRGSQRRRRGNGRVAIHELRDGTRYADAGSPKSRNSSVHELRDGTVYATLSK